MSKTPNWFRCDWDLADATAMQALERGEADEDQQKRVLSWIINQAATTYQVAWEPNNERASSFEAGRRFVGLEIIKLLKIDIAKLRREQNG